METRKKRSQIGNEEIFLTVLLVFCFRGIMLTLHEADVVSS